MNEEKASLPKFGQFKKSAEMSLLIDNKSIKANYLI
ncbi:hypothetical protein PEDI_31750 [Persicobacter diffluens]|uniref:Uncharacterized protein n=1 Tax=Persicobacter diffluens TaxID=981 RepID=A0AAN5AN93_9BACT|nr:hypothetical protein PEDI_31750 [Persicobacter diffluens]